MITVESPIVGNGGRLDYPFDTTEMQRFNEFENYVHELYRLCNLVGFDWRILFAQAWHETAGFTSSWWAQRLNPAGIGITGDAAQNDASHTWANGTEAARAHVVHMALYLWGASPAFLGPLGAYLQYDPRAQAVLDAGFGRSVKVLGDLGNGKWAADPNYAQQIAATANQLFKEESMSTYPVAGLSAPIELPVPLIQQIIPRSQTNQRPGIARQTPGYWVQHETANTSQGADAQMHSRWLNNGADGAVLSFHFAVDDHSVYQMIPVNEVTWQAADGAGPGNMSGVSCELCVNVDGDEAAARHNAEALAGAICKALGLTVAQVKRHWDFNAADPDRHHCPDHMMAEGYWPTFVTNVGAIIKIEVPKPEPMPSVPWGKDAIGIQDLHGTKALAFFGESTAKRRVPVRVAADSKAKIIATLPEGSRATVRGSVRTKTNRWVFVEIPGKGVGRALWSAFAERWPTL